MSPSDKQHLSAVLNLRQARREARELGDERRDQVRRQVQEIKTQEKERLEDES